MTLEDGFRILLGALLVVGIGLRLYCQRRAEREGGPVQDAGAAREPLPLKLALYALLPLVLLPTLAYLIQPGWFAWSRVGLPPAVRVAGAGILLVSFLGSMWTLGSLGTNITRTVAPRAHAVLVTRGPYRWVRHPLYACGLVGWAGVALMAADWLIGVGVLVAAALVRLRAPIEEANLIARFGEPYREYMRRTGRFLPRCTPSALTDRTPAG